jgi:hypothetical protein
MKTSSNKKFIAVFLAAKSCGFNAYESKALAGISFNPKGIDATTLGLIAGIPRSRVYDVVQGLIDRNLVESLKRTWGKDNRKVTIFRMVEHSLVLLWIDEKVGNYRLKFDSLLYALRTNLSLKTPKEARRGGK